MNRIVFCTGTSCIIVGLCVSLGTVVVAAEASRPSGRAVLQRVGSDSQATSVVARIGDHTITREELVPKILQEIRPREEEYHRQTGPVTAKAVLRRMIAEKATSIEGRRLGYLQDEQIRVNILQFEQQQLVGRLLQAELGDRLTVEDSEIDLVMKDNPKTTREQARAFVQRSKVTRLREQFFAEVCEKRGLKKRSENFAKAAAIHQRLLTQPVQPRGQSEYWIKNSQITTDLSEEEKTLLLAVYEGGQFTLKDWFQSLCNLAPPRRPKDLGTAQGVEKLLDMALLVPVFAAEARSRGYDQDAKLRSDVKALEDQRLLYKMQEEKTKNITEPTAEQVKEHFERNPERFATDAIVKADQIWCPDAETARKLKGMLDEGADFQTVKTAHSLQKDVEVYTLSAGSEGLFWSDVWKGEPNQVLGPMPGFYGSGAKWRIVKVLEKTPAKVQPFSEQLASSIKWALYAEWRRQAVRDFEQELLEKYPHEVFSGRIKDLDPLEIAMQQQDK